jgi:hypothetical protein
MNQLSKVDLTNEEITARCISLVKQTKTNIDELGEYIYEMKRRLGHGKFLSWLKEIEVAERTARYWMEAARPKIPEIGNVAVFKTELVARTESEKQPKLATIERKIIEASKEKMRQWDQRSKVMVMHIKQFLTTEEPVGRDLFEAIENIDKFEFQEDIDQLMAMQQYCEQLAIRAAELARKISAALKEKGSKL